MKSQNHLSPLPKTLFLEFVFLLSDGDAPKSEKRCPIVKNVPFMLLLFEMCFKNVLRIFVSKKEYLKMSENTNKNVSRIS
jgi:hypothetical protein